MARSLRGEYRTKRRARVLLAAGLLLAVAVLAIVGCSPEIPSLLGLSVDQATQTLRRAGLTLGEIRYDEASRAATWTVVAQSATGPDSSGTAVHIIVAGRPPVTVPDFAREAFESTLVAGLSITFDPAAFSESVARDGVISQDPAPGSVVPSGTTVTLTLSKGPEPPPSTALRLRRLVTLSGNLSPKSVVATQHGLVFAQNMIYRHTISVFDQESRALVRTIPDRVRLSDFGYEEYDSPVRGGPVEAAVTPDGRYIYVSNYSMYGPGFSHPGDDQGGPGSGVDPSFVYRIPADTLKVDQVIKVGSVPKFLAVTPDGRYLLVSNWISYTLSVVDVATGVELRQIRLGRYPRGIAVSPDSKTAYVAVMGSTDVAVLDLDDFSVGWIRGVGSSPRHLVMSPDGRYLYATLNGSGKVVKISLPKRRVIDSVVTGNQPRSMTISPDGLSLYVVNYVSGTVSKVSTADMTKLQDVDVGTHPIGITYVDSKRELWVACYRGTIVVFKDR